MLEHEEQDSERNRLTGFGRIGELATAAGTGLPPQIQRSFWTALGRIFTAAAELPVKYLEGKGRVTAAKTDVEVAQLKAEAADVVSAQKARDLINKESVKIAARRFEEKDLAERAVAYHAAHIIRAQGRREEIFRIAAEDLHQNPPQQDSIETIDEDLLEAILGEGCKRSSVEFQILFGRILSGEIRRPGAFSIGTIQSLGRLTKETATIFQNACNISTVIMRPMIIQDPYGKAGANCFTDLGLSYDNLARLIEDGLIRPEFNETTILEFISDAQIYQIEHAGLSYFLYPNATQERPAPNQISFSGPSFTRAGEELRSVVTMSPSADYQTKLTDWILKKGCNFERYFGDE